MAINRWAEIDQDGNFHPQVLAQLRGTLGAITGTGSPEGVVTAARGATYTDTNGTAGAWTWTKTTDTGNTGWIVANGDTGWRNMAAGLLSGTVNKILVRRDRSTVSLEIEDWVVPASGNNALFINPAGFRPRAIGYMPIIHGASRGLRSLYVDPQGSVNINNASTAGETISARVTWATSNTWPTSLPGAAF